MKKEIIDLIALSLKGIDEITSPENLIPRIEISETKNKIHGDFSSNIALILSKELKKPPHEIAKLIINSISNTPDLEKVEVAGPGFINFFLSDDSHLEVIAQVHKNKEKYGLIRSSKDAKRILIEYVSSNPTGPLHVGHGRGAAYGSSISNLLKATGHIVEEEYYVNDYGRQMDILTISVFIKYLQFWKDLKITYPKNCYQGNYIKEIAKLFSVPTSLLPQAYSDDLSNILNKINECTNDKNLDELISIVKQQKSLQELEFFPSFNEIRNKSLTSILSTIKEDLKALGVKHTNWFYESSLYQPIKNNAIDLSIEVLNEKGLTYKKEGATWFKSSQFGDDKDRVIIRENKEKTYFASDIAYHFDKYQRNFDQIINIWGSDHHGYLPRVKAVIDSIGKDKNKLHVIFVQFANLIRDKKKVSMSTRGGEFVSLKELVEEVSKDAARFFYIMRKSDQHLDFDLDLAKEQTKDNPLFYIQYAHARICSILKQGSKEFNIERSLKNKKYLELLELPIEIELSKQLKIYPETVFSASEKFEPHLICYFLKDLAANFHSYYNSERILIENKELQSAKLLLISAIKQVISNGLKIIGVSAPDSM